MNKRNWKLLAKKIVEQLPNKGIFIKKNYNRYRILKIMISMKIRRVFGKASIADREKIYWINPDRIEFYTNYCKFGNISECKEKELEHIAVQDFRAQVFDRDKDKGKIYGGDWDISDYHFTELEVYKALKARIEHGIEWENTDFYRIMISRLEAGKIYWNCHDEVSFKSRCLYLDRLINSMKTHGYKLNSDVFIDGDDEQALLKHGYLGSEVLVNIGREGQYLFQDGRHRLAIAKILGINPIPVKVLVRHEKWQELRELLTAIQQSNAGASRKGVLYQSPIHPDLSDFNATHGCEDRFKVMEKYLIGHSGNLLDVGTNLGYFCHRCEELGYNCYAVELHPELVLAANAIRIAEKKKFQIIEGNIFSVSESSPLKDIEFDTVIALNILHHFLKTEDAFIKLKLWLQNLKVNCMFFESHRQDEGQMINAYANFGSEEFVQFILQNTSLTNAEFLCTAKNGRKVYKLYIINK